MRAQHLAKSMEINRNQAWPIARNDLFRAAWGMPSGVPLGRSLGDFPTESLGGIEMRAKQQAKFMEIHGN